MIRPSPTIGCPCNNLAPKTKNDPLLYPYRSTVGVVDHSTDTPTDHGVIVRSQGGRRRESLRTPLAMRSFMLVCYDPARPLALVV